MITPAYFMLRVSNDYSIILPSKKFFTAKFGQIYTVDLPDDITYLRSRTNFFKEVNADGKDVNLIPSELVTKNTAKTFTRIDKKQSKKAVEIPEANEEVVIKKRGRPRKAEA